jgi:glycosyltransferase involved in cell wall biosynthesis
MSEILLSVLIPSIPRRIDKLRRLLAQFEKQSDPRVEVLVFLDNMRRPLGCKRNALMQQAAGEFLCHIDDDDGVADDFVQRILWVIESDLEDWTPSDLIAYDATASLNGAPPFKVTTRLGAENEQPQHLPDGRYSDIVRTPWTWCAWRSTFARRFSFPTVHDGAEDAFFLRQALPEVKSHRKINAVLFHHYYSHADSTFS